MAETRTISYRTGSDGAGGQPAADPPPALYAANAARKDTMSTAFNILAIVVMAAVVFVLIRGLINMMRGGSGNTSNKLMQARVALQFVAIVLIVLAMYFAGR